VERRCRWVQGAEPLYVEYHDKEWGRVIKDDQKLFERISLEGMQAGLSWIIVLRKREAFRKVFYHFDIDKVAAMKEDAVLPTLLQNAELIRSENKLRSIIKNARLVQQMQAEGESLTEFLWSFAPTDPFKYADGEPLAKSSESEAMSKALKKKGFTYVGPVICYALMQATGMVQDHSAECELHRVNLESR